jgi:transmembrane sensor
MHTDETPGLEQLLDDPAFRRWVYTPTAADEAHWQAWQAQYPAAKPTVALARHYLLEVRGNVPILPEAELSDRVAQLMAEADDVPVVALNSRSRPHWRWWYAAASVALAVLGYVGFRYGYVPEKATLTTVAIQRLVVVNEGSQPRFVSLGDGSTVVLQPNSRLSYEQPFRPDSRRVWLTGEAFFEVTKNPKQPFRVQADRHFTTEVLGTSFRIRAFTNEPTGLVAVKTGRVAVFSQSGAPGNVPNAVLTARQQAVVARNVPGLAGSADSPTIETTVLQPVLPIERQAFRFANVPLRQVMNDLEAAYGVRISYDPTLANCTLTATLGDEPLPQKLRMLCAAIDATYQIDGQTVRLDGPGCSPASNQ